MRPVRIAFAALAVGVTAALAIHCGSEGFPAADPGSSGGVGFATGPCSTEGAVADCHVVVAKRVGFVDCFNGQQTCTNGEWTSCMGGTQGGALSTHSLAPFADDQAGSVGIQSLSQPGIDASACAVDACNPYCWGFDEVPATPVAVPPGCVVSYDGGTDGSVSDASTCVTRITGTVYDPAGSVPLPNVAVYQPSGALTPLPLGATCSSCDSLLSPYTSVTSSLTDGTFSLPVIGTTNVKVVYQTGKWRRQVTIAGPLTPCVDNPIADHNLTRLPKTAAEGNIPLTAIAMATHEPTECLMLKIFGGDSTEFGPAPTLPALPPSGKRIQLYTGTGNATSPAAPNYGQIYNSQTEINAYDQVIFPCLGASLPSPSAAQQTFIKNYGMSGGRMFLNHKSEIYTTSANGADHGFAPWNSQFTYVSVTANTSPTSVGANGKILGADAAHAQFRTWLAARGGYSGGSACTPANAANTICTPDPLLGPITPGANAFEWIRGVQNNNWGTTPAGNYNLSYSFDVNDAGVTPTVLADGGAGGGCGRVIVNSMHVDVTRGATNGTFPAACNNALPLTPNELMFEYLLFQLGVCSVEPFLPPPPPPPPPIVSAPPTTLNYNNTYTWSCPNGSVGQWDTLGYRVNTPVGTEIKLFVQTSDDGGAGTWVPTSPSDAGAAIADIPLNHPGGNGSGSPSCTASGPMPCGNNCASSVGQPMTSACPASCSCPVDLFTPLSTAPLTDKDAQRKFLKVNASLVPSGGGSCLGAISPGLVTTSAGTNAGCSGGSDLGIGSCTTNADCNQDFHCQAGACVWSVPSNYIDPNCKDQFGNAGVDLTLGVPCQNGANYMIPICNRGGGTVAAGTVIALENDGNGGHGAWNCSTTNPPTVSGGSASCTYTLPTALGPGACKNIDTSLAAPNGAQCAVLESGHRDIYINYLKGVTECGTGFTGTGPGCMNNSTDTKSTGGGCAPACGSPAVAPGAPTLSNWTVTYACVPTE